MKKLIKDKAFTLIELLAVILILGIIALIAVPTVTNVIEDSKKGALKTTVRNLTQVAELQCEIERLNGKDITNIYTIEDGVLSSYLDIKNLPSSGTIIVDDECNVTVSVVDGNYCATLEEETVYINTNTLHCGEQYVDVPKTDNNCFEFDPNTRTITGYDFNNASCPTEISIPATIDNVPVEHIGDLAFLNVEYDALLYYAVSSDGLVFHDTVKENILKYPELSIYNVSAVNYLVENPTKNCYLANGSVVELDIDYVFKDEDANKYFQCVINRTYTTHTSDSGIITKVNFAPAINLKTIGMGSFLDNQITKVMLSNNEYLSSIGLNAFGYNLISGELDLSNLNLTSVGGFGSNSITKVILPNIATTLDTSAFTSNFIDEIIFGSNISIIGVNAFAHNSLTGILILPESLTKIGVGSFSHNNIETLKVNDKLKEISAYSFNNVETLKSVTFGSNVENIGYAAFGYTAIETLEFNEKLKTIGEAAFFVSNLSSITFNDNLESIGPEAFAENTSTIETLVLPDKLTVIEYSTFNKTKINNLTVGDNITDIKEAAFNNCGIQDITWGSSLKTIGKNSFLNNKFKTFSLPEGITYLGVNAFAYSYMSIDNEEIALPESLENMAWGTFYNLAGPNLKKINIGSNLKTANGDCFHCVNEPTCGYTIYIDQKESESKLNPGGWGNAYATILWKTE